MTCGEGPGPEGTGTPRRSALEGWRVGAGEVQGEGPGCNRVPGAGAGAKRGACVGRRCLRGLGTG